MKTKSWVFCIFLLVSSMTQAALLQWDAFESNDQKAVKDEATGLIWLDLDQTAGLAYQNAAALYSGWQYASYDMVEALLDGFFNELTVSGPLGSTYLFEQNCTNTSVCYRSAKQWQDLFGSVTGDKYYQQYSYGLYADENSRIRMGGAFVNGSGSANIYASQFTSDYTDGISAPQNIFYSSFLVKSVAPTFQALATPVANPVNAPADWALLVFCLPWLSARLLSRRRVNG
jgi:hypothetical protein